MSLELIIANQQAELANRAGFITVDGHPIYVGEENDTSESQQEDVSDGNDKADAYYEKLDTARKEYARVRKYKNSDDAGKKKAHDASYKRLQKAKAAVARIV